MTISDVIMVLAVIAAPMLAVQAQKWLEAHREKKARKLRIFKTLMTTRATRLSPLHVEALNMIDIEFYGNNNKDREIVAAWKIYFDHLCHMPTDPSVSEYKTVFDSWCKKGNELFAALLHKMGNSLGYNFDLVYLNRSVYAPEGHAEIEFDLRTIRKGLVEIMRGNKTFPIELARLPQLPISSRKVE